MYTGWSQRRRPWSKLRASPPVSKHGGIEMDSLDLQGIAWVGGLGGLGLGLATFEGLLLTEFISSHNFFYVTFGVRYFPGVVTFGSLQ